MTGSSKQTLDRANPPPAISVTTDGDNTITKGVPFTCDKEVI